MEINLINKVDELINIFENSYIIQRIQDLKQKMHEDQDIKYKIERFNQLKDNVHNEELITIRQELLKNPLIKEYKQLENELLLLTFKVNEKLNTLTNKKGCLRENN